MQPCGINIYMINRIFKGILFIALLVGASACCKKRTYCDGERLNIIFTGFDHEAVRSVVLKRYSRGEKEFTKALDSSVLVNSAAAITGKPDTSKLNTYKVNTGKLDGVRFGSDWKLVITSLDKEFYISDIYEGDNRYTKVQCKDNNTKCTNGIKSYVIGGLWVEDNTLYIRK